MNSIRHTRHYSLSADDLHLRAKQNGNEELVGVNLRRLIEGMLARYSSDFFVFRELIQNADDAKASTFSLEIKCDAPSTSQAIDFHNRIITEICMTNDGLVFSEIDWKRVATIADGNTDATSVGRFGVGFFSVYSYTDEPIIVSGKEYMTFFWRTDNSLATLRQNLPIEQQQQKTTSIILKMQEEHILQVKTTLNDSKTVNKDVPIIDLTHLKAYFAKVLSFTRHITNLEIKINHLTVFQVNKRKMVMPSDQNTWVFQPQPSIRNMLLLNSFSVTKQILTIANGPSITLGHVNVEARLNIDQQFHDHIRRILNKNLPSIVQIQLLYMPTETIIQQQHLQLSALNNDLNIQIFNSILPLKFVDKEIVPAGLIFIGLGTHQSTGIGMHVCSHLIPTVERENIDLQDPYIAKWNKELLSSIGQIIRCIYDQIIIHSSRSTKEENYDAVMAPYSFQNSTPEKEIGTIILNGFFASKNQILVPVKRLSTDSYLSLISSTEAFLADSKYIQSFLSFPFVPFELSKNRFFIVLKERRLINHVDKSIIKNELASSILSSVELIELLNWFVSNDIDDRQYIKHVLSNLRFRDTTDSSIISFGELDSYDASQIPSVLPLPINVLPAEMTRHFSQDQLQNKLFLSPCTFKDLIDSYLHKSQYYLLQKPKTAACLLSQFSKYWNQFSESKQTQIKNLLSTKQCIPTTQGMKLPKDSYMPSRMLKSDLPTVTLNLLQNELKEHQTNNSYLGEDFVSAEFLKHIGCRMLHIPSLIDGISSSSSSIQGYQSMEALIENLIQERKNMSDADFNALKTSKFLRGITLESMERTIQLYTPEDLHFSFVAEKLNWSNLLIVDWKDIDPHSAAYNLLKELGVREVPNLHRLINRIIHEHSNVQVRVKRRKYYKLPVSLKFFAENFQKHYSTLWGTSKNKEPFLPSHLSSKNINSDVILSTPDRVFTDPNPLCATLLPQVVKLFHSHFNILLLGIKAQPTLTQAFDILMEQQDKLLIYEWACRIFAYLNELEGPNRQFKEDISQIPFILVPGTDTLMKPSEVFIRSDQKTTTSTFEDINTNGLIDYVDFGPAANSFLMSIGVRDYPSPSILAELLIDRQEKYFANFTDDNKDFKIKLEVYTKCLIQLAIDAIKTSNLQNEPIQSRLKNEPWCLAIRQLIDHKDGQLKEECRIMRPNEVYLNDNEECVHSHNPWRPPKEPLLNKLYEQFGAKWLSDCVSRQLVQKGKAKSTIRSKDLHNLIQTRINMLFVDRRGEKLPNLIEKNVELLRSNLSIYEADKIQCQLTFQNKTIILNSDSGSSCAFIQKKNQVILYIGKDLELNFLHIARELARFIFKKPSDDEISTIYIKLSSSLETLKNFGIPVDQLMLNTQSIERFVRDSIPYMRPPSPLPKPTSRKHNILSGLLGAIAFPFVKLGRSGSSKHLKTKSNLILNIQDDEPRNKTPHIKNSSSTRDIHEPFHHDKIQEDPHFTVVTKNRPVEIGSINDFKQNEMEFNKQIRCILDGQPYRNSTMTEQEHIEQEISISCIHNPTVNMICVDDHRLPIPLYVVQDVDVTNKMIRQAQQLAWVLTKLATDVFKIPRDSIHLFRDIDGNRIAFNYGRALFFNLRYFEQIFADDLNAYLKKTKSSQKIVSTIVNFYFITVCHELTHNIHPGHDLNFLFTLQKIIVKFMVQKESFFAQFSFDNYKSHTSLETF